MNGRPSTSLNTFMDSPGNFEVIQQWRTRVQNLRAMIQSLFVLMNTHIVPTGTWIPTDNPDVDIEYTLEECPGDTVNFHSEDCTLMRDALNNPRQMRLTDERIEAAYHRIWGEEPVQYCSTCWGSGVRLVMTAGDIHGPSGPITYAPQEKTYFDPYPVDNIGLVKIHERWPDITGRWIYNVNNLTQVQLDEEYARFADIVNGLDQLLVLVNNDIGDIGPVNEHLVWNSYHADNVTADHVLILRMIQLRICNAEALPAPYFIDEMRTSATPGTAESRNTHFHELGLREA